VPIFCEAKSGTREWSFDHLAMTRIIYGDVAELGETRTASCRTGTLAKVPDHEATLAAKAGSV